MARSRNIKPGFFKNEVLGTADPFVSLLFAGLWTLADKAGILEDRPIRIKAELFPYRDGFDINGYLTELERLGFIHRYEVDGMRLIQVAKFSDHQHPHHTEKESIYPSYSECCQITVKEQLSNGYAPSDSLNTDSLNTDSRSRTKLQISLTETGEWKNINGQMEVWKKAYPELDVESELAKAAAWIVSNPTRRKSNYSRFINGWLGRAKPSEPAPKHEWVNK